MKQFINDKYFRFAFSDDKKICGFSVSFPINSGTIEVAVVIMITIIIITITNNKYIRSSLSAFVSMINLFWFDLINLFKVGICIFPFQNSLSLK